MALPEYSDLYAWVHGRGGEPLPVPQKRPTRKGLGRYLRDCYKTEFNDDAPRWMVTHMSCVTAYATMLDHFNVRLPSDTFAMDKLYVAAELERIRHERERDHLNPEVKAMAWARSR